MGIAHKLSGRLPFLLATRTVYLPNRRTSLLVGQCQIILPGDKFSYFTIAKECRVEVISARAHSLTSKATINGINNSWLIDWYLMSHMTNVHVHFEDRQCMQFVYCELAYILLEKCTPPNLPDLAPIACEYTKRNAAVYANQSYIHYRHSNAG